MASLFACITSVENTYETAREKLFWEVSSDGRWRRIDAIDEFILAKAFWNHAKRWKLDG